MKGKSFPFPEPPLSTKTTAAIAAGAAEADDGPPMPPLWEFKSVVWLCVELQYGLEPEQELIVMHALHD